MSGKINEHLISMEPWTYITFKGIVDPALHNQDMPPSERWCEDMGAKNIVVALHL
jgi:hypothetical protein